MPIIINGTCYSFLLKIILMFNRVKLHISRMILFFNLIFIKETG